MSHSLLFQAIVYLAAAVAAVPIAKRLGLGSVLGYLLAGVLIGPHALGLVGGQASDVQHFAEFGVVMMLFLIGLELQPAVLWKLRVPILGLGGLQVLGTALVAAPAALAFGLSWRSAVAAGFILAMSSTAIVLQTLQEKGWSKNPGGQGAFAILLFQDIAVIPILALMPLLAVAGPAASSTSESAAGHGGSLVAHLPAWGQALAVLAAVALVVFGGRFLSRPVFRFIAGSRLREVFTATALLLVLGITLLMQQVGMSPALGAFLAGVVLADNEYRHELESDIEPFKGLLLGLFFITVGAGVDLPYILSRPLLVLGLVAGVMALKFGVLLALAKAFRLEGRHALLVAMGLCQVGEFAFVLLALAGNLGILAPEQGRLLVAVVALSMLATPPLFILPDRLLRRAGAGKAKTAREMDAIPDEDTPVIIAGFGRMGNQVGRLLRANGIRATVLDLNPDLVDAVRKLGLEAYYGDASRLDLLHAAGAEKARLMVVAIDDADKTLEIVDTARKHFPRLELIVRAQGRREAYALVNQGLPHVYRETLGTAMDMGCRALRILGRRGHQAHRATLAFKEHNERAFRELARHYGDDKAYTSLLKEKILEAEELLKAAGAPGQHLDSAWDNTPLREAARAGILKR
jgi:monovalent cation:proton antiporter-2 (CPA2) family protein